MISGFALAVASVRPCTLGREVAHPVRSTQAAHRNRAGASKVQTGLVRLIFMAPSLESPMCHQSSY